MNRWGAVKLYGFDYISFIQFNHDNGMQTAMASSISMTVFNCRDKGSANTCKDQGSTIVETMDRQIAVGYIPRIHNNCKDNGSTND